MWSSSKLCGTMATALRRSFHLPSSACPAKYLAPPGDVPHLRCKVFISRSTRRFSQRTVTKDSLYGCQKGRFDNVTVLVDDDVEYEFGVWFVHSLCQVRVLAKDDWRTSLQTRRGSRLQCSCESDSGICVLEYFELWKALGVPLDQIDKAWTVSSWNSNGTKER